MHTRFDLRWIAVFALLFALAHASIFDFARRGDVSRRQDDTNLLDDLLAPITSGKSTSVTSTKDTTSKTSAEPTTTLPTTTKDEEPTTTPTTSPSVTTTSPTTSEVPTTTSTEVSKTDDSTTSPSTTSTPSSSKTSDSSSSLTTSYSQSDVVVKTTVTVDGVAQETSYTSTTSVPVATSGVSVNSGSEETSKGMSPSTKKTVIGVVVGIVGAIVLGALFFVAWRIWGKRNREEEGDDMLAPYRNGSSHGLEKTSDVGSMPSPFTATLESYHNPTGRNANVSSNF